MFVGPLGRGRFANRQDAGVAFEITGEEMALL